MWVCKTTRTVITTTATTTTGKYSTYHEPLLQEQIEKSRLLSLHYYRTIIVRISLIKVKYNYDQECLNKKEIQLNLCNIFSTLTFDKPFIRLMTLNRVNYYFYEIPCQRSFFNNSSENFNVE